MDRRLDRRELLHEGLKLGSAIGVAGLTGITVFGAPGVSASPPTSDQEKQERSKTTVRTVGLGVSVQDRFLREFETKYGWKIEGTVGGYPEILPKFIAGGYKDYTMDEPNGQHALPLLNAKAIQPIPRGAVPQWEHARSLFTDPKDPGADPAGSGWPMVVTYTPDSYKAGSYDQFMLVPHYFGMDSIGFRRDVVGKEIDSYGYLYEPEYKGRTAIWNEAIISTGNAANYLTKAGKLQPKSRIANLAPDEVDIVIKFLIERKKDGQFRAIWQDYGQAVNLLATGEVVVIDAWSPIVADVQKQGKDAVYARVKEGYPGWFHGIAISSAVDADSPAYAAALDYIDFWLGGWPGAQIASQGYFSPSTTCEPLLKEMRTTRKDMTDYEAWYEGKNWPTGGLQDRLANIGWWEEWPENADYYLKAWQDFLAA